MMTPQLENRRKRRSNINGITVVNVFRVQLTRNAANALTNSKIFQTTT